MADQSLFPKIINDRVIRQRWETCGYSGQLRPGRGEPFVKSLQDNLFSPKKDQIAAPKEKEKKIVGPQGIHVLDRGDPLKNLSRPAPLPKENITTGIQVEDRESMGPQGSYGLKGGNPLKVFFQENLSSQGGSNQIDSG